MAAAYQPMAMPSTSQPTTAQPAQQLSPLDEYLKMIQQGEYFRGAGE